MIPLALSKDQIAFQITKERVRLVYLSMEDGTLITEEQIEVLTALGVPDTKDTELVKQALKTRAMDAGVWPGEWE